MDSNKKEHRHKKKWKKRDWKNHDWTNHDWENHDWSGTPGCLFGWFILMFGIIVVLLLGGAGWLIFTAAQTVGPPAAGDTTVSSDFSLLNCGIALFIPLMIWLIGRAAFAGVSTVANLMQAAEKVAGGDLTVRVPEKGRRNRFRRLAHAFNKMIAELQQADEQRRNLTADVAHELRTPLHIIQGNLEGILDGVYEPTPEHIQMTLDETHALARLVDDLHTITQAEAGQLPLQLEEVDVTELLADVQTSFSGVADEKGIDLLVEITGKPADLTLEADTGRLNQILNNLVVNALRHTPAGGKITLKAYPQVDAVGIDVVDTGEGIPEADLPFVFDRFWRGDRARSHTSGEGGGLGLAIVKQLVAVHNGRISVTSQPNKGTTFIIVLPK